MPAGSDIEFTSAERRDYQRNVVFGVSSGAFYQLAETFLHPTIVLAVFVSQITNDSLLIGLVPAINTGVWYLPQLIAAAIVQGKDRQLPFVLWASVVRALSIGVLGALGFMIGDQEPSDLLLAFFITYTVYNLAAGFGNVPMTDMAARAIPSDRRGFYFGQRNFWGGVLGFIAGFAIQRILGGDAAFPENYALLFFGAFLALALATYAAAMFREPPRQRPGSRVTVIDQLLDSPRFLANADFRRFLIFRCFLSTSAIADPFFVIYAQRQLNAPLSMIGLYIAGMTVARFGSNLFWSPVADRYGNRLVLQLSALLRMVIPMFALALVPTLRWGPIESRLPGGDATLYYLFGLVFVLYGVAWSGQQLANMTYLLDVAPEHERAAYVGLVNTILGVVSFVPVIGGTILDRFGFDLLFLVAFLIGLGGVLTSGMLHEPRVIGSINLFSSRLMLPGARRLRW